MSQITVSTKSELERAKDEMYDKIIVTGDLGVSAHPKEKKMDKDTELVKVDLKKCNNQSYLVELAGIALNTLRKNSIYQGSYTKEEIVESIKKALHSNEHKGCSEFKILLNNTCLGFSSRR